jgi:hypothetical protein
VEITRIAEVAWKTRAGTQKSVPRPNTGISHLNFQYVIQLFISSTTKAATLAMIAQAVDRSAKKCGKSRLIANPMLHPATKADANG